MQIFIRKWSEVSGWRFDPKFLNYTNKIRVKFPITFLNNLLKSNPMYGANEAGISRTSESQPRYIRITDIDDFGCLKDGLGATAQTIQAQYMLEENDILFARSGATVGKTYIHRNIGYESFFAGYMIKFRVDSSKISPYFVFLYTQLDIYKEWVKAIQRASAQPNINAEEYKNLLIPIPPKEIQQEIIDIVDNAYLCKKQKENEAKDILDSIDLYILDELDIVLPCKNTDLKHRIYTTKSISISGKRFDCEYHQNYYKDLEKSLSQGKYKLASISSVIRNIKKGIEVGSNKYTKEKAIPFIRVSDISSNGINFDDVDKFITRSLYDNLKAEFQPKEGELLYSKDGTIGICLEANYEKEYIISGAIVRIELCGATNSVFFQNLISLNIINILMNREAIGAVIKHLTIDRFLSLKIPLPPLPEQEKIANEIIKRKQKALKLQKEAKDILESAKIKVEKILLGEK